MLHKFILIVILLFSISCKVRKEIDQVIFDKNIHSKVLVGYSTIKGLQLEPFRSWYEPEYSKYQPDTNTIKGILNTGFVRDIRVEIVMGTWCSDSRREVPRFIKILEKLDYPLDSLVIINLDSEKKTRVKDVNKLNIVKIPTFIIYAGKLEIGRIVESPKISIEKDLYTICNNVKN